MAAPTLERKEKREKEEKMCRFTANWIEISPSVSLSADSSLVRGSLTKDGAVGVKREERRVKRRGAALRRIGVRSLPKSEGALCGGRRTGGYGIRPYGGMEGFCGEDNPSVTASP